MLVTENQAAKQVTFLHSYSYPHLYPHTPYMVCIYLNVWSYMYMARNSYFSADGVVHTSGDDEENDDDSAEQVKSLTESIDEGESGREGEEENCYKMNINSMLIEAVRLGRNREKVAKYMNIQNGIGMLVIHKPFLL